MSNIKSRLEIISIRKNLKAEGKKVVFTNGCFDILHSGHVDYLNKSKKLGDILIVAINSDSSIKNIKDSGRPILSEKERTFIVSNLKAVDYVTLFSEDTPLEIISELIPDVLVKGEDWDIENIVGKDSVLKNGGEVKTIKFVNNQSTSKIIQLILDKYSK